MCYTGGVMLRRSLAAGLFGSALMAATPPLPKPCFTITVEVKLLGTDHSEEHRFRESYRPGRMGDIGIRTRDGTQESCNLAAIEPGEMRRFFLMDLQGSATGKHGNKTASVRMDRMTDQDRDTYVTLTRHEKGATLEFSASSSLGEAENCEECFGASAVVVFQHMVFELSEEDLKNPGTVSRSVRFAAARNEDGYSGSGTATLNLSPTADEEMVFAVPDAYQSWLPAPMPEQLPGVTVSPSATRLRITVRIQPKQSSEARTAKIQFELQEVTRHKGNTGNYPQIGAGKDDLRFAEEQMEGVVLDGPKKAHTTEAVKEATVVIEAMDTAAWGRLTAKAPDLDLKALDKATNTYSLTIPRDTDGNKIADAWEGRALDPQADDEEVSGQNAKGDGLTVAAEYRGFVVLEDGGKVHHRLNPKRKELFVIDAGGIFDTGAWERASEIAAHKLDESLVQGGSGPASRIVNFLSPSGQPKYAVRLETISGTKDPDPGGAASEWGYTTPFVVSSPKDVLLCRVFRDRIRTTIGELYLWLGKALTVRGSPEEAELNELGLPRFVAQNALNQLSGAGLDQLVNQIIRLSAIHEVGHALGVPGHVNDKGEESADGPRICPMRYRTKKGSQRGLILQVLFGPGAALPGETKMFCRTEFDCFRKLNVKD
jgi:hypothetical protein